MNEQFLSALQAENLPVSLDESLGRHTTFRIGGNADFFCVPATVTQLTRILELCRQYQVRTYLLGNGSNTLFSDAGFGGAVICLTGLNSRFSMQAQPDGSTKVLAPAGMMLSALCNTAQKESLAGLEFAFGIPGTVGGAVYMNAGAYGGEIKDVLTAVTFLDENLHLQTLPVQELQLGYRTSIFERCSWCILEAEFTLHPGDAQENPYRHAGIYAPPQRKAAAGIPVRRQYLQAPCGPVCRQANRGLRPARFPRGRGSHQ